MSRRGRRGGGRPVHGVLLLDKPAGLTSNAALQRVKRLYRARKAGHTGSLDPLATGMLPICLGEATKISAFLLAADKRYEVEARLGQVTDTGDADGTVLETHPVPALDAAAIEAVLARFRGPIEQVPPMYSALKQDGRRLYELAREGRTVERAPRQVSIFELRLLDQAGDRLRLAVRCSKGTYVRVLVEDIGRALGCGAHVSALRRTAVAPFPAGEMVTLDTLERVAAEAGPAGLDRLLVGVDAAFSHLPPVALDPVQQSRIRQGQALRWPEDPGQGTWRRLYGADGGFIGVAELVRGQLQPRRLMNL